MRICKGSNDVKLERNYILPDSKEYNVKLKKLNRLDRIHYIIKKPLEEIIMWLKDKVIKT
jgi:protein associated with RNAse G/E